MPLAAQSFPPFTLRVGDAAFAELAQRLARTRWPGEPMLGASAVGTSVDCMMDLQAAV